MMQENGTHRGLSTRFGLDMSDAVAAENQCSRPDQLYTAFFGPTLGGIKLGRPL